MPKDWWKFWEEGEGAATALGGATAAAGLALANQGYDRLGDIGDKAYARMSGKFSDTGELLTPGLAQELQGMMEFQPYTVTTATGG